MLKKYLLDETNSMASRKIYVKFVMCCIMDKYIYFIICNNESVKLGCFLSPAITYSSLSEVHHPSWVHKLLQSC